MDYGGALRNELAGLVEECLGACVDGEGSRIMKFQSTSSSGLKIQVHTQQRLLKRSCVLRPDKREVVICIAVSSVAANKRVEAEDRILYCGWKWNTTRIGGIAAFWGCDLKTLLGEEAFWRQLGVGLEKGGNDGEEMKPLLLV